MSSNNINFKVLFPYLKNRNLSRALLIDKDSVSYITTRKYSSQIAQIIGKHIVDTPKIGYKNVVVTDGTAGVGGNTITFGIYFGSVNSIEIDSLRYGYLNNNIAVFGLENIITYNDDCINKLFQITNHDVIFLDPPWETEISGSYKKYTNLRLSLGGVNIELLCRQLMNDQLMSRVPSLIVMKLPKNYDIKYFYSQMSDKKTYYYNLDKMIILVIIV